ncbi:hypothetical protein O181_040340 [Austropuccinia psidii MF-1]|uniref:Exocyst complex component Sec10 n=1 Tax=Austropuccinia psidii MF-1 TaxID=1389203 RepID=A0A9Q3DD06_9BASI|nr:hypothetical protein [Austropuccinia psidii MF-1]
MTKGESDDYSVGHLSFSTFEQPTFSVASLLAGLTEGLIKGNKESGTAFNPDPFIVTLEDAIQKLIPLREQVSQKIQTLEKDVAQKERAYRTSVEDVKLGLDTVGRQFSELDSKINEVGKTAIRIGEQLESIDRVRSRAAEAHDIILYYNEFARGETTRLEALRKEGKEGRAKVAIIARRLLSVSRDVEGIEGGELTKATIEKYAERFEKDMLRLFEKAYLKGEPKAMSHCAQTLREFNGGHSCIQIYVNQHDFFISRERIESVDYATETAMWETLADPNKPAPKSEPKLEALYCDTRDQISQEAQIIEAVFPQPLVVMQVFLQRVFAQVVQGHIEKLIVAAQGSSSLAFLRVLSLARLSTAKLINDLKAHDFFRLSPSNSKFPLDKYNSVRRMIDDDDTSGKAAAINHAASSSLGVPALSNMLDQQLDELFSQHLDHNRYLDRESKSLTELYASYLLQFSKWHRAMNKAKPINTIFDRMVNQLSVAAQSSASTSGSIGNTQNSGLKSLLKLSGIRANEPTCDIPGQPQTEVEISDCDGELDLNVAEKMLTWHAEAVGRMIELSTAADVPKSIFSLLKTLAESFCKAYVETALETSLAQLSGYDLKTEPNLKPMTVIKTADLAMHLWQRYVTTAITPLAAASVTIRREMSMFNNDILLRIEGKINSITQKALECVLSWLNTALGKQKKADFKPKNDELDFTQTHTEACVTCCGFLNTTHEVVNASLNGKNSEVFLTEVAVVFHSLLLEHLKRFPVSAIGGLMLTKDLAMYQDTISKFNMSTLNERFEMIRELGNIFVVQPTILKSYLQESMLGKIDLKLLKPFLMMRSDYGDHSKKFWDEVIGVSEHAKNDLNGTSDKGLWLSLTT